MLMMSSAASNGIGKMTGRNALNEAQRTGWNGLMFKIFKK
jgi:hypothetical protein